MPVKESCSVAIRGRRRVEESVGEVAPARRETVVHAAGFYICIYDRLFSAARFVTTIVIGHACSQVTESYE